MAMVVDVSRDSKVTEARCHARKKKRSFVIKNKNEWIFRLKRLKKVKKFKYGIRTGYYCTPSAKRCVELLELDTLVKMNKIQEVKFVKGDLLKKKVRLKRIFPRSFFNVMELLMVHLSYEARARDPPRNDEGDQLRDRESSLSICNGQGSVYNGKTRECKQQRMLKCLSWGLGFIHRKEVPVVLQITVVYELKVIIMRF
ncbi:hypothetical protein M9H77_06456 [Catharanthus roseus]|uniref:Uncharacterized protein n=1 Tax=Catharanthus roseus TaxID=4058 RepID=A0ACC0BSC8_CATRO|nr:hypothetical protein M9H77_06456 [Catharanthus roseus]